MVYSHPSKSPEGRQTWRLTPPHGATTMRNPNLPSRSAHAGSITAVPELLTAKDLERLLKIDVKTIYAYVRRGLIPYVKIQSDVRFAASQICDWIEAQSFRPSSRQPPISDV